MLRSTGVHSNSSSAARSCTCAAACTQLIKRFCSGSNGEYEQAITSNPAVQVGWHSLHWLLSAQQLLPWMNWQANVVMITTRVLTCAHDALAGLFAGVNGFAVASIVINNCLFLLSVVLLAK
jgi:hypothetical protein